MSSGAWSVRVLEDMSDYYKSIDMSYYNIIASPLIMYAQRTPPAELRTATRLQLQWAGRTFHALARQVQENPDHHRHVCTRPRSTSTVAGGAAAAGDVAGAGLVVDTCMHMMPATRTARAVRCAWPLVDVLVAARHGHRAPPLEAPGAGLCNLGPLGFNGLAHLGLVDFFSRRSRELKSA